MSSFNVVHRWTWTFEDLLAQEASGMPSQMLLPAQGETSLEHQRGKKPKLFFAGPYFNVTTSSGFLLFLRSQQDASWDISALFTATFLFFVQTLMNPWFVCFTANFDFFLLCREASTCELDLANQPKWDRPSELKKTLLYFSAVDN